MLSSSSPSHLQYLLYILHTFWPCILPVLIREGPGDVGEEQGDEDDEDDYGCGGGGGDIGPELEGEEPPLLPPPAPAGHNGLSSIQRSGGPFSSTERGEEERESCIVGDRGERGEKR